ncbi:hypothetical protein KFK09_019624 [Dendrobium nobile]|uniref:Uncharacterized protein n=1 Tax=Dendrobium nobile TaxID=94219 RepID=A0A8T3ASQ1_DENNO|nr:hypothetical protein KFK09_019624 [Dendrobium nobile]
MRWKRMVIRIQPLISNLTVHSVHKKHDTSTPYISIPTRCTLPRNRKAETATSAPCRRSHSSFP